MSDNWTERASCRGLNPNLFFPERGDLASIARAKAVCAGCPVRAECLQYAIDSDQYTGIWGGVTRRELQMARRGRPQVVVIEHGTDRGYSQHRRAGTPACEACKRAHAIYKTDRRVRSAS